MVSKSQVGVVGAGLMGREIALVFALAGYEVILVDANESAAQTALSAVRGVLEKGRSLGFYTADQLAGALKLIRSTTMLSELAGCSFVTEAVSEDEGVKAQVFKGLSEIVQKDCIVATNTSTIPISVLASYLSAGRRSKFIGTHYFSPVSRMKLVEIILGLETSKATLDMAQMLCREIGKSPIVIKDVPGFAVNRLLHVMMIEAVRLVEEGVASPEDIDEACRLGLGHPMGPFQLMDATTSSLCLQAQAIMHEAYGERFRPRPLLKQRVRAGFIGGKGKPGWLSHEGRDR
jgi:3-hydroxybutyryl-CoA dehydrogenase